MYAKKWLDHVWESFSKIICVLSFESVLVFTSVFLDEWSFTSLPTTNVMVGLEFLTKDILADIWIQTYDLYIDSSYAVTSFPHNIYSLQYLLQHFSRTLRNIAGHSRAGTLMGAFQLKGRAGEPTWRPKIAMFERRYIFQIIILCIYFDFRRCIPNWDHTIGTMCSQIENHPRCLWHVLKSNDVQSFLSQKPL